MLGLDVTINAKQVTMWPASDKVVQWTKVLEQVEQTGILSSGLASKMAGRLNFAAQHCFRKFGRAMIRPFYCQQYAPLKGARCDDALMQAVRWWLEVFQKNLVQNISLKHKSKSTTMFCDASSSPPMIAAVLFEEGKIFYCEAHVPEAILNKPLARNDDQIMALELYTILFGLGNFNSKVANSNLTILTDNAGGECALRKHAAKAPDHNMLVHKIWVTAASLKIGIWINRVASSLNIADGPTRPWENVGSSLLNKLGAIKCTGTLPREW